MTKTIFDGTKLPLVEEASRDHYVWYQLPISAPFGQSQFSQMNRLLESIGVVYRIRHRI
jgi:hypothetical protein